MGSRGPLGRPDRERQGHRASKAIEVAPATDTVSVPNPPAGLLPSTLDAWHAYWRSSPAQVATEADHQAILRLFVLADEFRRCTQAVRSTNERVVEGSVGQVKMNPLSDYALKLEAAIGRLETELGLTPMARARLGLTIGQARLTAADVNRMALEARNPLDPNDPDDAALLAEFEDADQEEDADEEAPHE